MPWIAVFIAASRRVVGLLLGPDTMMSPTM
jgi:hypothetical protein